MCAMDRVAHFPMGHLVPPPMGQKATPTAKEVANGVKRCLSIGSAPEAQGPMSVCQQRDLATKKGGRDSAPSGKESTPQEYTLLEGSADGPNGPFLFHLDYRVDPACWP